MSVSKSASAGAGAKKREGAGGAGESKTAPAADKKKATATPAGKDSEAAKKAAAKAEAKRAKKEAKKANKAANKGAASGPSESKSADSLVSKCQFLVGEIKTCIKHPDADKLLLETIACGEEQDRTIVSGLVGHYEPASIVVSFVLVGCRCCPQVPDSPVLVRVMLSVCGRQRFRLAGSQGNHSRKFETSPVCWC